MLRVADLVELSAALMAAPWIDVCVSTGRVANIGINAAGELQPKLAGRDVNDDLELELDPRPEADWVAAHVCAGELGRDELKARSTRADKGVRIGVPRG